MDDRIEWPAYKDQDGYGRVSHNGKQTYAHRIAYCKHHGIDIESIKGIQVRHACDNPPCVNPNHLLLGTNAQNMLDKVERGRQAHNGGAKNGQAKLSDDQVAEIRAAYIFKSKEFGSQALAQKFNVSISTIQRVVNGSTWSVDEQKRRSDLIERQAARIAELEKALAAAPQAGAALTEDQIDAFEWAIAASRRDTSYYADDARIVFEGLLAAHPIEQPKP